MTGIVTWHQVFKPRPQLFYGDTMGIRVFFQEWRRRCPFVRAIERWRFERRRKKFEVGRK